MYTPEGKNIVPYGKTVKNSKKGVFTYQANDMWCNVRQQCSLRAAKLLMYIASEISPNDITMPTLIFDVRELAHGIGLGFKRVEESEDGLPCGSTLVATPVPRGSIKDIKATLELLTNIQYSAFCIRQDDNTFTKRIPYLERVEINEKNPMIVGLKLSEELAPFYLELHKAAHGYSSYNNFIVSRLRNGASLDIYRMIKSEWFRAHRCDNVYSLEMLHHCCGLAGSGSDEADNEPGKTNSYSPSGFISRYIKPACEEITEKTEFDIDFLPVKIGKKITHIRFDIKEKEGISLNSSEDALIWAKAVSQYHLPPDTYADYKKQFDRILSARLGADADASICLREPEED